MIESKIYTISKTQQKLLNKAIIDQGELIYNAYKNRESIEAKYKSDGSDFSTQVDQIVEKKLSKEILKIFPNASIFGEEFGYSSKEDASGLYFFLDPIDGTKYFKNQIPLVVVSVGIQFKGKNIYGVLFNPLTKDIIYGGMDYGVYSNNKHVKHPKISLLNKTQIYYDTVGIHSVSEKDQSIGLDFIRNLQKKCYRARSAGASCAFAFGAINGLIGGIIDVFGSVKITDRIGYSAILQGLGWEERRVQIGTMENLWLAPKQTLDALENLI